MIHDLYKLKFETFICGEFDIHNLNPIKNSEYFLPLKPQGGLWSSPIGRNFYPWKKWCKQNDFGFDYEKRIIFKIKKDSKIFIINSLESISELIYLLTGIISDGTLMTLPLNVKQNINWSSFFNKYDMLFVPQEFTTGMSALYGWDVDTLFLKNSENMNIVKIKNNKKKNT